MDKLKMYTADITDANIQKIGELFPNCLTERLDENGKPERAIDFDKLKQELSKEIVEGNQERYQFTWPGKREAMRLANTPTNMTLRPCREDSVDFDNTENLYIEGDNLEVLKLLRENYLGKVKMIYIDPPYNTGNDFVYKDDFVQDIDDYKNNSGQKDEFGNRMVQNTESNGRFHSDWLNMMCPRLKVARDLLSSDGVIFISIDDNEIDNLRKICDEIFGEINFVSQITVVNNIAGRSDSRHVAKSHEYILIYQRSDEFVSCGMPLTAEQIAEYKYFDDKGRYRLQGIRKRGSNSRRIDRPNLFYPIFFDRNSKKISFDIFEGAIEILPNLSNGEDGCWRWGKATFMEKLEFVETKKVSGRDEYDVFEKVYLDGEDGTKTTKMKSFLLDSGYTTDTATGDFKSLMEAKTFTNPKPVKMLKDLIHFANCKDSIILDFFSGSGSFAQAAMEKNKDDYGNRRFILVQIPEITEKDSEAFKAGYLNICKIGEERVKRAGLAIHTSKSNDENIGLFATTKEKITNASLDTGFRVLKLDTSNMEDVYYKPEEFSELQLFEDNVKPDRTPEDLLFQVMLECNLPLSAKIEKKTIAGKEVFNVNEGYLIACFDKDVNEQVITEVAKQQPYYFIMRDSSLSSDNVADNFEQIFNAYCKDTIRKIL